jgi:hypothetical protein
MDSSVLEIGGLGVGILGLCVGGYGIIDGRRQRNKREQANVAAREVIARTYGLLRGIKAAVDPTLPKVVEAIDDGLAELNQQRKNLP